MGIKARAGFIVAAAFAVTACATADLTVQILTIAPTQTPAGSQVIVQSTVRNIGDKAAPLPIQALVHVTGDQDGAPLFELYSWERAEGPPLAPNEAVVDEAAVVTPSSLAPGGYFICADADPEDVLSESDERNNRLCAPLAILAGPIAAADLVIENVTALEEKDASLHVKVKIRNAGVGDVTTPFRIMAFKRSPREPLYLKKCPLTEGQLAAGSPSLCEDVIYAKPLAAGASGEVDGYFNYLVSGAEPLRQPLRPGPRKPSAARTVDFMVDGCFKPAPPENSWCAVNEIDEINNFREARLQAR